MMKTQQEEVYAAERTLLERGTQFDSIKAVQAYLDDIRDRLWWDYPDVVRVEVYGANKSQAGYDRKTNAGLIELHPKQMDQHTVLHELAHVLAQARDGSQAHDPWWVRTLLILTYWERGSDAFVELREAFLAHDVVIDPKDA